LNFHEGVIPSKLALLIRYYYRLFLEAHSFLELEVRAFGHLSRSVFFAP
jgi:hypothetical protein